LISLGNAETYTAARVFFELPEITVR